MLICRYFVNPANSYLVNDNTVPVKYHTVFETDSILFEACCPEVHTGVRHIWKFEKVILFVNRVPLHDERGEYYVIYENLSLLVTNITLQCEGIFECECVTDSSVKIRHSLTVQGKVFISHFIDFENIIPSTFCQNR